MSQADRDPAAKGMTDHQDRLVDPDSDKEGVHPGGITLDRAPLDGQVRRAPETRQRRGVHPTPSGHQLPERASIGAMTEAPPVQEHHRRAVATDRPGGVTIADLQRPRLEAVRRSTQRRPQHHASVLDVVRSRMSQR